MTGGIRDEEGRTLEQLAEDQGIGTPEEQGAAIERDAKRLPDLSGILEQLHEAEIISQSAMDEIKRLKASNAELIASLKEMREACAAAFRALEFHPEAWKAYELQIDTAGVKHGFGKRAQDVIAKAEGK